MTDRREHLDELIRLSDECGLCDEYKGGSTMNDETMALAAVKAGVTAQCLLGTYHAIRQTLDGREYVTAPNVYPTPIEALAAAGRALGLTPDVVVVPVEAVANAIAELPWAVENARACAGEAVDEAARKTWTRHADVLEATLVALGGEPS